MLVLIWHLVDWISICIFIWSLLDASTVLTHGSSNASSQLILLLNISDWHQAPANTTDVLCLAAFTHLNSII